MALALFVLLMAVSHAAAAGAVRMAFTPTGSGGSAKGTLHVTDGKPTDDGCRFRLSITGLKPNTGYRLDVHGSDGFQWYQAGIFTEENGSRTLSGGTDGRLASAATATIMEEGPQIVVLNGQPQ